MAHTYEHSVKAVVMDCIDRCGKSFVIPVELVSSEPVSRDSVTFTVRIGNTPETSDYVNHCATHLIAIEDEEAE